MPIDINNLTIEQKRQLNVAMQTGTEKSIDLARKLNLQDDSKFLHELREAKINKSFVCPHCGETHVVRYGKYKVSKQRYLCRNCHVTFSDLPCSSTICTRYPEKWESFIECMLNGYSLRKSAGILDVSLAAVLSWRHKLLEALKNES